MIANLLGASPAYFHDRHPKASFTTRNESLFPRLPLHFRFRGPLAYHFDLLF